MKQLLLVFLCYTIVSCNCSDHNGFGRYTLRVDCDHVTINGTTYGLSKRADQDEFIIDGHTIGKGIYRKTRPWLYVHATDFQNGTADVTFEEGLKDIYPLYTGSAASVFEVFAHPWEARQSTCFAFESEQWLVAQVWKSNGVLCDVQRMGGTPTEWDLVTPDILVPADGQEVLISELHARVKLSAFNEQAKTATFVITPE